MDKINKIKEWIIVNYRKEYILNKFDNKEFTKEFTKSKYYKWLSNTIILSVDRRFFLEEKDMNSVNFFVNTYIMLIVSGNKNLINENKK